MSSGEIRCGRWSFSGAIEATLGYKLPWTTIYHALTLESLADCVLEDPARLAKASSLLPIRAIGSTPPLFMVPYPGARGALLAEAAKLLGSEQIVYGFVFGTDIRVESLAEGLVEEMRRVQPAGPYFLSGHSYGGLVAFEAARRLGETGEQVGLLAHLRYEWTELSQIGAIESRATAKTSSKDEGSQVRKES